MEDVLATVEQEHRGVIAVGSETDDALELTHGFLFDSLTFLLFNLILPFELLDQLHSLLFLFSLLQQSLPLL